VVNRSGTDVHVESSPALLDLGPAAGTDKEIEPFLGGGVRLEVVRLDVVRDSLNEKVRPRRCERREGGAHGWCHLRVPHASESGPSNLHESEK